MNQEIIISGLGGQGVLSMGQLLAYASIHEEKHVSWLPSYGAEQRGGSATCAIVISDEPVGSMIVSKPTSAIVLDNSAYDRLESKVASNGLLLVNTSLINRKSTRMDIDIIEIDATKLANELGNQKIANMILLGAYISKTNILKFESIIESLKKVLGPHKQGLIEINEKALQVGNNLVKI
ncbi:MAG: pyruvate/ketoisovalerate oxidoreductase, gamma subunit [Bacillales bacterium]|jgi:2-oxoglutarate ferredoxin oxidoreductase subunit gamma|nr:pyruvate/ketoisovalerate oxidoreductase, gamma subunit [Bacillales bacterium]